MEQIRKGLRVIKHTIEKAKQNVQEIKKRAQGYYSRNFGNTKPSMKWLVMLLLCVFVGITAAGFFPNKVIAFIAAAVLTFIAATIAFALADFLLRILLKGGIRNLLYITVIFCVMLSFGAMGIIGDTKIFGILFVVVIALALIVFSKALWAIVKNKVYSPTTIISLAVGMVTICAGIVFWNSKGFHDTYVEAYLDSSPKMLVKEEIEGFADMMDNGIYTVESMEYSPYKEDVFLSKTVDLSAFVKEEEGLSHLYRKYIQKFDLKTAPIAGKVWYPKEVSNCPVVFIAHGNHEILTESYLGYSYLGEYLASYGYVVVSVDQNVLNLRSNENDARAVLLLDNIKFLQRFNKDTENPLYQKMDYENIAIAGHSRGGEMVTTAYLFNEYQAYPENGVKRFDYHFNIKSILAIAPTVGQYMPADHEVEIYDVNYLVLHGANDQDVSDFMGNEQFENVKFREDGDYLKSSLYIAGANHGQFNSEWGAYDVMQPISYWMNVENFIGEDQQQDILKYFAKVFLDKTLKNDETFADLLINYEKYNAYLPDTIYMQQSQGSDFECLSDFEEDSDLTTASLKGSKIAAYGVKQWTEEVRRYLGNEGSKRNSYAVRLEWENSENANIEFSLNEPKNLEQKGIQFDLCDMQEPEQE